MAEITVKATLSNLDTVLDFVNAMLKELNCPSKVRMQIDIAVEELFVNIARYAYAPEEGSATVRMDAEQETGTVTITFIDSGIPYDPLAKPDPDVTLSAAERKIGGLGIFMVKKSMDDMKYRRQDGQNILTITKALR